MLFSRPNKMVHLLVSMLAAASRTCHTRRRPPPTCCRLWIAGAAHFATESIVEQGWNTYGQNPQTIDGSIFRVAAEKIGRLRSFHVTRTTELGHSDSSYDDDWYRS